jgi:putative Mg2+ transporter-C (MgtC) family protein
MGICETIGSDFCEIMSFFLPKLVVSTICGGLIGYDREIKQKAAGIRTNILICTGCTLFACISFYLYKLNPSIDPSRIIGQIVTGVGFLGAGAIMKTDDKIVGVTTAAFIWVASAIGILTASIDSYTIPIVLTIGLIITSRFFEKVENFLKKRAK